MIKDKILSYSIQCKAMHTHIMIISKAMAPKPHVW